MKHTPTPWAFVTDRITGDNGIRAEGTGVFAEAFADIRHAGENARVEALANAALIVRAVNAHDELLAGLRKIATWFGEFPKTGQFWENTDGTISDRPMSYAACFGSNGERDYMRRIAADLLAKHGGAQ